MADMDEHPRLEPIPREECIRLLASVDIGRLAVVDGDQPMIFPVNYATEGEHVVIRSDEGSKLDATRLRRVAFEVDDVDPLTRTGWSVVVQGIGHDVTDALDTLSEHVRTLPLHPWPGQRARWIRIVPGHISGRRIVSGAPQEPSEPPAG